MKKLLLVCLLFSQLSHAQKRPLNHNDYDGWNTINETKISENGQWAAYILAPQDGDSRLVFYPLRGNAIDTIDRASDLWLSKDSQWAAFKISPFKKEVKEAKIRKVKKDDMPKDSVGFHNLNTHETVKFGNIKSFNFPEKSSDWVAFLNNPVNKTDSASKAKKSKKESDINGSVLNIYSLKNNTLHKFSYVNAYNFDPEAKTLIFYSTGKDSTFKSGLYSFSTETQKYNLINKEKGTYKHLVSDESGSQFAAIFDPDTTQKALVKNYQLLQWQINENPKTIADTNLLTGVRNLFVSADFKPEFSKNGQRLFLGTLPRYLVKDTTRIEEDVVSVDVWNWKDKRNMPQQLANLSKDQKASYLAVYDVKSQKISQIASEEYMVPYFTKEKNEENILLVSPYAHGDQHWFFNPPVDVFLVDTENAKKNRIIENKRISDLKMSPDGKTVLYFSLQDTAWFCYHLKNQKTYKITESKDFSDVADDDHPDEPGSYGVAGFLKDQEKIWLYDKFDIWEANLGKSKELKRLTKGREKGITYRYIILDEKASVIETEMPVLLHQFNHKTKASGYARLNPADSTGVSELIWDNMHFSEKVWKARNSDDLVFTAESFEVFPDLQHTQMTDFKEIQKISTANPQQESINWGRVELVDYQSQSGKILQGMLYRPADFDPTKKYPMITYFYEKMSDEIHSYIVPQPVRSSINFSYYTSNGYFVFVPDIVYKIGYPGKSAMDCIIPGVKKVLEMGFVDSTKLGIQGHSWGGYQTAYIITQTPLFAAAEAGAPVANMTSAYGGIRWETGLSRQAQYERTQSRLGVTLWEDSQKYLENSPLFYLPSVKTPLLMMHNDDDGAVPWYQGIEMFMGLKRLSKPVWMINYNGEKHGLTQRKNRKDWTIRMAQFFDYYLKGQAAPQWMIKGVPATEKTLNYGLEK
ncbi:MAG: prolyl oligopeptidase family serine peptidase [Spirosomataceae bacterium]